jgi:hypothetical protein
MRALCVICCGRTPMIAAVGAYLPEVRDTLSDKTFQKRSIITMDLLLLHGHTNW